MSKYIVVEEGVSNGPITERGAIMKIGYVRVSRDKQVTDFQVDAMKKAGIEKVFTEKESGAKDDRPVFLEMLAFARPGDTIVVWRLDRLGRSLKQLMKTVEDLQAKGIDFMSLTENIDTSTPSGKFTFHLFGALAEMERDIIRERTSAGLEAARARGKNGGRPALDIPAKKLARAKELYAAKEMTIAEIMDLTGFKNVRTFYKYVVHATA